MAAARGEQKGDRPSPSSIKKVGAEAQLEPGSAQESRRERAPGTATQKVDGVAPNTAGERQDKARGADVIAHDFTTAIVEVSRANADVLHAAAETTVEVTHHALEIAEEETASIMGVLPDPMRVPRRSLDRASATGVTLFEIIAQSAEASLRVMLDLQTSALSAGMSMLDAANAANRALARQWAGVAHAAHEAAMASWREGPGKGGPSAEER